MAKIVKSKLYKPEIFLLSTGELKHGKEEFVYITSLLCDNINQTLSGEYFRLIKESDTDYEILADARPGGTFKYFMKDGKPFTDIDGVEVYLFNQDGSIKMVDGVPVSRTLDYSNNIGLFGAALAAVMLSAIKYHMGYHPEL